MSFREELEELELREEHEELELREEEELELREALDELRTKREDLRFFVLSIEKSRPLFFVRLVGRCSR